MDKPLVRVTQIEAFRRYYYQSEHLGYEISEQSVIDAITQQFTGNSYTRIGSAFHSIVERGIPPCTIASPGLRCFLFSRKEKYEHLPEGRVFNVDGYPVTFDISQCDTALRYRYEHPNAFHECRVYKDYGEAVVTGCADMIDGIEIRDIKTKFSTPSDSDYFDSCQWRFYLELFGVNTFHFDIFSFEGYDPERHGCDVRGLRIYRHVPAITCYRYKDMSIDNRCLLEQFLHWAEDRQLLSYLRNQKI